MGIYEAKDVQRTPHGLQMLSIVWAASDRASDLSGKASLILRIDLFHLPSCNRLLMTLGANSSYLTSIFSVIFGPPQISIRKVW